MGQTIDVKGIVMGDVALFDTDRSMTGQDGYGFGTLQEAREGSTTAALLAAQLFEEDSAVNHVHVLSNAVTVRRAGEWADDELAATAAVIRDFFTYYEENRGQVPGEAADDD